MRSTPGSRRLIPTPSPPHAHFADVRVPGIRPSDRLLQELRRLAATHPGLTGSLAVRLALAALLLDMAAFGARGSPQASTAEAAATAQRIARTRAR